MLHFRRITIALIAVMLPVFLLSVANTVAADPNRKDGWEQGSSYNKLYDASETDYFRANVVKVKEIVPMQGMSAGVALIVKEAPDEEPIEVHVCPKWYMDKGGIGLKRGDRIKIRGVWAEIDGKDVFLAAKIKRGDYFVLKVRLTKDGKPFWSMTEEELNNEKTAVGSQ
jgi:hypothetical protein